jgi:hypothetical protein
VTKYESQEHGGSQSRDGNHPTPKYLGGQSFGLYPGDDAWR